MPSGTLLRAGLLAASMLVAATAIFVILLTYSRNDGDTTDTGSNDSEYTSAPSSVPRLGAAAYFPQGTNPPVGSQLEGEPNVSGNITLVGARLEGDVVTAFGTFVEGEPECELLSSRWVSGTASDVEVAGDAFLFTSRIGRAEIPGLYVRCELSGRPADVAEREVSG